LAVPVDRAIGVARYGSPSSTSLGMDRVRRQSREVEYARQTERDDYPGRVVSQEYAAARRSGWRIRRCPATTLENMSLFYRSLREYSAVLRLGQRICCFTASGSRLATSAGKRRLSSPILWRRASSAAHRSPAALDEDCRAYLNSFGESRGSNASLYLGFDFSGRQQLFCWDFGRLECILGYYRI
jgi:hypothetical protein